MNKRYDWTDKPYINPLERQKRRKRREFIKQWAYEALSMLMIAALFFYVLLGFANGL